MAIRDVQLQWVLVDGALRKVSEFAGLSPGRRPDAVCPLCRRPVILKLGQQRAHHAAHYEGAICAATQPETALHLNMKYHLLRELSKANELLTTQKCLGRERELEYNRSTTCDQMRNVVFASAWDSVQVEYPFNGLILDVALLKDGQVVTAIEVFVTHRVDDNKRARLEESGLSWIEIEANEQFYDGDQPWTADVPLSHIAVHYPQALQGWRCDECLKPKPKIDESGRVGPRKSQNDYSINSCIRFVDIYYPSGKHFREIFSIKKKVLANGINVCAWLEMGDYHKEKPKTIQFIKSPITDQSIDTLKHAFRNHLRIYEEKGAVVDSPMHWHEWPEKVHWRKAFYEDNIFPKQYEFTDQKWIRKSTYSNVLWDGYWEDRSSYLRKVNTYGIPQASSIPKRNVVNDVPLIIFSGINQSRICIHCGQETSDYWYSEGSKGTCKCRQCYEKGLS